MTRGELLSITERQTVLSRRELREDSLATACIWARPGARWPLEALQSALRHPHFTLYAGRKANVLGLPLAPDIVEANSLAGALAMRQALPDGGILPDFERLKPRGSTWGREVAHDPLPDGVESGLEPGRTEVRRDGGAQRARWQFAARTVFVGLMPQARTP